MKRTPARHQQLKTTDVPKHFLDMPSMMASCRKLPDNTIVCEAPDQLLENHLQSSGPAWNFQASALGEEKNLAVLFLDIRNFTVFMESRSPYEVIYVIRKLFAFFNESIREAGGRIVETAGDSIYAVFGLEGNLKDAVNASANAAKAIFQDLEVFNASYANPYFGLSFEIGIGLHCGRVVVGTYDFGNSEQMTVMGLPVNIASRIQSATKELNNDLLISADAFRLLDDPATERNATLALKGLSDPVQIYLLGHSYH